jgi:putative ABC transport system ATP-binding protein
MIELDQVSKRFNEGQPNEVLALRDVNLQLPLGEISVLEGPSGSGKTTLLTLIGCVARPSEGRIRLGGELVSNLPELHLAELRRRRFGIVFQRFNLIAGLSALDNVMLPAYPLGLPHRRLVERAREVMAQLSVGHRAEARVELLSGGEMQRVAIARALIHRPHLVLADEPTGNLDPANGAKVLALLAQRIRAAGAIGILVTHSAEAAATADRVLRLSTNGLRDTTGLTG